MADMLQMQGITKVFGNAVANDHIDLTVREGEIHALLGENGAGKTTLMNILYGLYRPTSGQILLRGKPVAIENPLQAINLKIGMIHQHFMLIPAFTVLENIILGLPSTREPFLDVRKARERIKNLIAGYGLAQSLAPDAKVETLSTGLRQQVEILKALYRGADLLVLDEPTGVLTPQESIELFETLKSLARQGHSVIFISHKLDEVMGISDRISVLRKGKLIHTVNTKDTTKAELARLMVGRDMDLEIKRGASALGKVILKVEDLCVPGNRCASTIKNISFEVREGEILGVAGVDGNGQSELMEALNGLRRPTRGTITLDGGDVTRMTPAQIIDRRVAFVPEERKGVGTVKGFNIDKNLMLRKVNRYPFSSRSILNYKYARQLGDELIAQYDVRLGERNIDVDLLSGGNLQKIVLARELSSSPKLLLVMHPTRGLDIGAIQFIHEKFMEISRQGIAIVLVSTELEEIMALCDTIIVLCNGEKTGQLSRGEATVEKIGAYMAGICDGGERSGAADASVER